jgi:hypothetical protein
MYLVLTMMSASWGQMLSIVFSKKTALLTHFYTTVVFIICSGAILDLTNTNNFIVILMRQFSPLRFATEWMLRQVMESNG